MLPVLSRSKFKTADGLRHVTVATRKNSSYVVTVVTKGIFYVYPNWVFFLIHSFYF